MVTGSDPVREYTFLSDRCKIIDTNFTCHYLSELNPKSGRKTKFLIIAKGFEYKFRFSTLKIISSKELIFYLFNSRLWRSTTSCPRPRPTSSSSPRG